MARGSPGWPGAMMKLPIFLTRRGLTAGCANPSFITSPRRRTALSRNIEQALRNFEYQAHWLNLMTLLGEQLSVPEVKLVTHTLSTPAIPVDLILDVGNTHTCGVLIEDHGVRRQ